MLRTGAARSAAFALLLAAAVSPAIAEPVKSADIYVVDGDTIDVSGNRFRLVGFDTPETYYAKCDYELALGNAATKRLRELIRSGKLLDLVVLPGRDKYDRGLARFYVGGTDVAQILMGERLARPYSGGRRKPWC